MTTILHYLIQYPLLFSFIAFYLISNSIENAFGDISGSRLATLLALIATWIASSVVVAAITFLFSGDDVMLLFIGGLVYCFIPFIIWLVIAFLNND